MTSLSPINATAQTALQLFQRAEPVSTISATGLAVPAASDLLELGGNLFSPRTSEALSKIAELTSVDPSRIAPTEARKVTKGDVTYYETATMSREDLPEAIRDRIGVAASYTLVTLEKVSDEEFHDTILTGLKEWNADDASFQKALREGTLVIQRPEDVAGFTGWESYRVTMYNSEGYSFGGTYFGGNGHMSDFYKERAAEGYGQSEGTINNQDFYAYWPGQDMEA